MLLAVASVVSVAFFSFLRLSLLFVSRLKRLSFRSLSQLLNIHPLYYFCELFAAGVRRCFCCYCCCCCCCCYFVSLSVCLYTIDTIFEHTTSNTHRTLARTTIYKSAWHDCVSRIRRLRRRLWLFEIDDDICQNDVFTVLHL